MARDFERAVSWGCGIWIGLTLGSLIVGGVLIGGCVMLMQGAAGVRDAARERTVKQQPEPPGPRPQAEPQRPRPRPVLRPVPPRPVVVDPPPAANLPEAAKQDLAEKIIELAPLGQDPRQAAKPPRPAADEEKAAASLVRSARTLAGQGNADAARRTLQKVLDRYPQTDAAAEARQLLSRIGS